MSTLNIYYLITFCTLLLGSIQISRDKIVTVTGAASFGTLRPSLEHDPGSSAWSLTDGGTNNRLPLWIFYCEPLKPEYKMLPATKKKRIIMFREVRKRNNIGDKGTII